MSTVSISPPQPVILKGFMNEPIEVFAVCDRGDSIEVAKNVVDEPMPFHTDSIFEYDACLLAELKRASDLKDEQKLRNTWARATPFRKIA